MTAVAGQRAQHPGASMPGLFLGGGNSLPWHRNCAPPDFDRQLRTKPCVRTGCPRRSCCRRSQLAHCSLRALKLGVSRRAGGRAGGRAVTLLPPPLFHMRAGATTAVLTATACASAGKSITGSLWRQAGGACVCVSWCACVCSCVRVCVRVRVLVRAHLQTVCMGRRCSETQGTKHLT